MSLVRDYASGGATTGLSVALTVPATVVAGDTMIGVITGSWSGMSASGGATANGWTTLVADGGSNLGGGAFYATATAGSAGTTVTLSMTNGGLLAASLLILTIPNGVVTRYSRSQSPGIVSPQSMGLSGPYTASSAFVSLGGCQGASTFTTSVGTVVGQASGPNGSSGSTFAAEAEPGAGSDFGLSISRTSLNNGQWYFLAQIDPAGTTAVAAVSSEKPYNAGPPATAPSLLLKGRPTKTDDAQPGG